MTQFLEAALAFYNISMYVTLKLFLIKLEFKENTTSWGCN
jgi:hypothetical protein